MDQHQNSLGLPTSISPSGIFNHEAAQELVGESFRVLRCVLEGRFDLGFWPEEMKEIITCHSIKRPSLQFLHCSHTLSLECLSHT